MRCRSAALGACAIVVALVASGCITGPLPPGPPDPHLTARGYFQTEYFLGGTATAYGMVGPFGTDGRWTAKRTTSASYNTRLLVRRPFDARRFNGTVLVEWLNVSAGSDIDVTSGAAIDELLRDGYAFVGVSAQKTGVDALRSSNPSRYGSLFHPGDDYSYDIFSQAGAAVRGLFGPNVLGGLHARRVIAAGESQSAFRFVTYINAVHPLAKVFDAFLIYSRGAGAAALFTGADMPTPALIRTDQPVPIIDLQTEGDIVVLRSHLARQPDSTHFRLWEVAGGSHADEHTLSRQNPPSPTSPGSPCQFRSNSASTFAVVSAAVSALNTWVRDGLAPRSAPRITLGPDPSVLDPVVRDAHGNALGGIRLPELEVPISTITGLPNPAPPNAPAIFQAFCRLFGQTIPFSASELAQLYPSHDGYFQKVVHATDSVVAKGFVLREDGEPWKLVAAASNIGEPPATP
ncbi:MAG: hypothetical protein QOI55_2699 [Actinomycetota bacterium]|nr:hypothetical protein [Actinomycetota bacterium]